MPNHAESRLVLTGRPAELQGFMDDNREVDAEGDRPALLDFNRLLPTPEHLHARLRRSPEGPQSSEAASAVIDWRIENWGTKWIAMDVEVEGDPGDGKLTYRFWTAYGPPDGWLTAASSRRPDLEFHHECVEEFAHFAFKARWRAGEVTHFEDIDPFSVDWVEWEKFDGPHAQQS